MREQRWIVTGKSLIDDKTFGPQVLSQHPSQNMLFELAEEWGDGDGDGNYGTTVDLNIEVVNIEVNPNG